MDSVLLAEETQSAQTFLLHLSQREVYFDLLDRAKDGVLRNIPSSVKKFDVSVGEDGLLRIQGRLRDPSIPQQPKSLILLHLSSGLCRRLIDTLYNVD